MDNIDYFYLAITVFSVIGVLALIVFNVFPQQTTTICTNQANPLCGFVSSLKAIVGN